MSFLPDNCAMGNQFCPSTATREEKFATIGRLRDRGCVCAVTLHNMVRTIMNEVLNDIPEFQPGTLFLVKATPTPFDAIDWKGTSLDATDGTGPAAQSSSSGSRNSLDGFHIDDDGGYSGALMRDAGAWQLTEEAVDVVLPKLVALNLHKSRVSMLEEEVGRYKAKVEAKNMLETYCFTMGNTVNGEELKNKFEAGGKEAIEDALGWLHRNELAGKDEFEAKQTELDGIVYPIMLKVNVAASAKQNEPVGNW